MIVWRVIAVACVLVVIGVSADTLRHESFDSGVVGTLASPHYLVRCEGLKFGRDATVATVRVIDTNPFPQFEAYHKASARGSAAYIYVPATHVAPAGWLRFVRFEELPDLVLNPKPSNDIHEAVLRIAFEPITRLRSDPLNVDEVYIGFPGFRPFVVRRRAPVSQSQNTLVAGHNAIVSHTPPLAAQIFLAIGAFAFCGIAVNSYRQRGMLFYRWKLKQLETGRKRMGKENVEGEVLVPPRWDEQLIALQFRSLAHRPAMLGVLVNSIRDCFVLNQDEKTASARIRYLITKLEELKVSKELQHELDDLKFRAGDLDIRRMEQELKKGDLEHRVKTQGVLRDAEHKRDLQRVKLETAQIDKQMRDLKPTPPAPAAGPSSRIHELRERIQRAKEQRAYARETTTDPDEWKRKENLYDDKIAQLEEELSSLT